MGKGTTKKSIVACLALALCLGCVLGATAAAERPLEFWYVGEDMDARLYRRQAKVFAERTGIAVRVQPVSWGNFQTKYMTAMASGNPPDVGITNLGGPTDYGRMGGVLPLDKVFPDDIAALRRELFPNIWGNLRFGDRLYGVPAEVTSLCLFYRTDVFERLGLSPPRTWDELERVVAALNAHDYLFSYCWTRNEGWALGQYVWPMGTDLFTPGGLRVNWADPDCLTGIQFAAYLWNAFNITSKQDNPIPFFASDEPKLAEIGRAHV